MYRNGRLRIRDQCAFIEKDTIYMYKRGLGGNKQAVNQV